MAPDATHRGAATLLALDLEPAAVLLDVPLRDREPEPGALLPGREERLAHRRQRGRRNAGAGVRHLDQVTSPGGAPFAAGTRRSGAARPWASRRARWRRSRAPPAPPASDRPSRWEGRGGCPPAARRLRSRSAGRCRKDVVEQTGRLSGMGWNGAGRLKLRRWLIRRSSRSTSPRMASRCSPAEGEAGMLAHELRGGAQARERVAKAVRHRRRHLADRGELLRLHQLRLGAPRDLVEPLGHRGERAGQLADLVPGRRRSGGPACPSRQPPWPGQAPSGRSSPREMSQEPSKPAARERR